jgi:hypothetical protein
MSRMVLTLRVTSVRPEGDGEHRVTVGNFTTVTGEHGSEYSDEALLEAMLRSVDDPPAGGTPWRVEEFAAVPVEDVHG